MIPQGFSFSAVNAGIKSPENKNHDLGLIVCSQDAVLSGVFTRNLVKAAPVLIGMGQVKTGKARAVIANSGNANACTGQQGIDDARAMMKTIAEFLRIDPEEVVPLSTGVIGMTMPMDRIQPKLTLLIDNLGEDAEPFARSIMTTDTFPKIVAKRAGDACVLGMAKGAGMIAPDMATTLAVVLTDAKIDKQDFDNIIYSSIEETFNAITVDGDTSTNDTLIALSSGLVTAELSDVRRAVKETIRELALMIVADGEGATKILTIEVEGTATNHEAKTVAMSVANSLLVKTAIFGADPNWGRIATAIGYSGVILDPGKIAMHIQELEVVRGGMEAPEFDENKLHAELLKKDIFIRISLGNGPGKFTAWTTDLSYLYVEINSQYRT
jgi:glutamate N-acetyltransferase / amino-acid N-acetyltransferase